MNPSLPGLAVIILSCCVAARAAGAAPAAAADAAAEACEKAVADAVREARGAQAQDVQFSSGQRRLSPLPTNETAVKGEGRYRGGSGAARSFTYTCAFNADTGEAGGVLFREAGPGPAGAPAKPWQPDLTNLSPEACEAAAAAALKRKYPRIDRITFGSDSRELKPGQNGNTSLEGKGALVRAAGMRAVPFTYRCEVEPRSGKVVGVQASD